MTRRQRVPLLLDSAASAHGRGRISPSASDAESDSHRISLRIVKACRCSRKGAPANIAPSRLDVGDIRLARAHARGQHLLRDTAPLAQNSHCSSQGSRVFVHLEAHRRGIAQERQRLAVFLRAPSGGPHSPAARARVATFSSCLAASCACRAPRPRSAWARACRRPWQPWRPRRPSGGVSCWNVIGGSGRCLPQRIVHGRLILASTSAGHPRRLSSV